MEKIARRVEYVKAYRARQKVSERIGAARRTRNRIDQYNKILSSKRTESIRVARLARREDWLLGPIAPRRDAGEAADTYGTTSGNFRQGVPKVKWRDWGIRVGDRVAVIEPKHRERGKIGTVTQLRKYKEDVLIDGLNLCDYAVPKYMLEFSPDKSPTHTIELPIPLPSVRLIHPAPDPITGKICDTIIDSITIKRIRTPEDRKGTPYRLITNTTTSIPWPASSSPNRKTPDKPIGSYLDKWTHKDGTDTPAPVAGTRTWIPNLIGEPFPSGVMDELRNKYSKYRDRHEAGYMEMKEEKKRSEERREEEKRVGMMTPMEEWRWRKEREREEKRGEVREVGRELLEGIGRVMAENRGGWMERLGKMDRVDEEGEKEESPVNEGALPETRTTQADEARP